MPMKKWKCVSITCTSHKQYWVHIINTITTTDNPNKCNEPRTRKQHWTLHFSHNAITAQPQNKDRLP